MNDINFVVALNKLGLSRKNAFNKVVQVPSWASMEDFIDEFIPYVQLIIDSREQDKWIKEYCDYFNISWVEARKDKKAETENLKEGDITFKIIYDNYTYDFTNKVAYERKGKISEFVGNCTFGRATVEKEFQRMKDKGYDKIVLLLQFGDKLTDLINLKYGYYNKKGKWEGKTCEKAVFTTVMSWLQPNKYNFHIIQSKNKTILFWLMLLDMFYYFRQFIRLEYHNKNN